MKSPYSVFLKWGVVFFEFSAWHSHQKISNTGSCCCLIPSPCTVSLWIIEASCWSNIMHCHVTRCPATDHLTAPLLISKMTAATPRLYLSPSSPSILFHPLADLSISFLLLPLFFSPSEFTVIYPNPTSVCPPLNLPLSAPHELPPSVLFHIQAIRVVQAFYCFLNISRW